MVLVWGWESAPTHNWPSSLTHHYPFPAFLVSFSHICLICFQPFNFKFFALEKSGVLTVKYKQMHTQYVDNNKFPIWSSFQSSSGINIKPTPRSGVYHFKFSSFRVWAKGFYFLCQYTFFFSQAKKKKWFIILQTCLHTVLMSIKKQ